MDPISPFMEMGLAMGGVVICTGLFIWNTIELRATSKLKESLEELTQEMREQRKVMTKVMNELLTAVAKVSEQTAALAGNQLNLTHSVNEVVRELIGVIREVEKH